MRSHHGQTSSRPGAKSYLSKKLSALFSRAKKPPELTPALINFLSENFNSVSLHSTKLSDDKQFSYDLSPLTLAVQLGKFELVDELLSLDSKEVFLYQNPQIFTALFKDLMHTSTKDEERFIIEKLDYFASIKLSQLDQASFERLRKGFKTTLKEILSSYTPIDEKKNTNLIIFFTRLLAFANENGLRGELDTLNQGFFKSSDFLIYAMSVDDVALAKLFLEYNVPITQEFVTQALQAKNEKFILFLLALSPKYFTIELTKLLALQRPEVIDDLAKFLMNCPIVLTKEINTLLLSHAQYYYDVNQALQARLLKDQVKEIDIPDIQTVTISHKLFGHIHNDRTLKGTHLEGMVFADTMQYLNQFIEDMISSRWQRVEAEQKDDVNFVNDLFKIRHSLHYCTQIANAVNYFATHSELHPYKDAINYIVDDIFRKLKSEGELLMPGGWKGEPSGHAMLYEIKKNAQGKYVFLIYNTGSGVDEHFTKSADKSDYFASVKAYEMNMHDVATNEVQLKDLIQELMHSQVSPGFAEVLTVPKKYESSLLYKRIDAIANKIGMQEVDPQPYTKHWLKGQNSGTCTERVLNCYLKNYNYTGDLKFQDLRYEKRRYSIEQYYNIHFANGKTPGGVAIRQMNFALQNFSLLLSKTSTDSSPLAELRRQEGLALIEKIRATMDTPVAIALSNNQDDIEESKLEPIDSDMLSFQILSKKGSYKPRNAENPAMRLVADKVDFMKIKFEVNYPLDSLKALQALCENNLRCSNYLAISDCIEHFYLSIPIVENIWDYPPGYLLEFLQLFTQINAIYATCIANQSVVPFVDPSIILLCGKTVAENILLSYLKNDPLTQIAIRNKRLFEFTSTYEMSSFFMSVSVPHSDKFAEMKTHVNQGFNRNVKTHPLFTLIKAAIKNDLIAITKGDAVFQTQLRKKHLNELPPDDYQCVLYFLQNINTYLNRYPVLHLTLKAYLLTRYVGHFKETYCTGRAEILTNYTPEFDVIENFINLAKFYVDKSAENNWELDVDIDYKSWGLKTSSIRKTQPKIGSKTILNLILERDFNLDSNKFMVRDSEKLTEETALLRTLKSTQIQKGTQIVLTLNFMKRALSCLEDRDIQQLVFCNLLEVGLLKKQLIAMPSLLKVIEDLIQRGLTTYVIGSRVKKPALFFLKLNTCIQSLLIEMKGDPIFEQCLQRATEVTKRCSELIEKNRNTKNPETVDSLWKMHSLNMIAIGNQIKLGEAPLTLKQITEFLSAVIFRRKSDPGLESDSFMTHEADNMWAVFEPILIALLRDQNLDVVMSKLLPKMIPNFLMLPSYQWQGAYPEYQLMDTISLNPDPILSVNFRIGQLHQAGMSLGPLPPEVYNAFLYKRFFTERPDVARFNMQDNSYEFTLNNIEYRFIVGNKTNLFNFLKIDNISKNNSRSSSLQKQVNGAWYTYDEKTLIAHAHHATLQETGNTLWKNNNNQEFIVTDELTQTEKFQVVLVDKEKYHVRGRDAQGNFTYSLVNHHSALEIFADIPSLVKFETPEYTELYTNTTLNKYILRLPRYNLEFEQERSKDGQIDWIWKTDPRYKIKISKLHVIAGFDAVLVLTPIIPGLDELVLIPKQQFMLSGLNHNPGDKKVIVDEYHDLQFDTGNHIADQVLLAAKLFKEEDLKNSQLRKLTGTEQYATYVLRASTELIPQSIEDRYYLAYVYLAMKQPLLAFDILQAGLKDSKELTFSEQDWLFRMMNKIPADAGDPLKEEHAKVNTPEILAVRALAGYILARHVLDNTISIIQDPKEKESAQLVIYDVMNDNKYNKMSLFKLFDDAAPNSLIHEEYANILKQKRKTALANFDNNLMQQYENYYSKIQKIPEVMRLSASEEEIILRKSFLKNGFLPPHLIYRSNELKIQNLMSEKMHLDKLHAVGLLKTSLHRRRESIAEEIQTLRLVQGKETILKNADIDIKMDMTLRFLTPVQIGLLDNPRHPLRSIDVAALGTETPVDTLMRSMQVFYRIAIGKDSIEKKKKLKAIVEARLIHIAQSLHNSSALSVEDNLYILLSYALYFPEKFAKLRLASANMPALIDTVNKLQTEHALKVSITYSSDTIPTLLAINHLQHVADIVIEESLYVSPPLTYPNITQRRQEFAILAARLKSSFLAQESLSATSAEFVEGEKQNQSIASRNAAANIFFRVNVINSFKTELEATIKEDKIILTELKHKIIALANKLPEDSSARTNWLLKKHSFESPDVLFKHVLQKFLQQNPTDKDINALVFDYLSRATANQHHQRLLSELEKMVSLNKPLITGVDEALAAIHHKAGTLLQLDRCYNPAQHPRLLLYEFLDNKLIFPKQYDYLKTLLDRQGGEFSNQVIQLIMGGGKSKLITPLRALEAAKGHNLSMVVVPDALYEINRADLTDTTQKIFGKAAVPFYFNESVTCNIAYLKHLKETLLSAISHRDYIVTTKESLQSLNLHYLKSLNTNDKSQNSMKKRKLLNSILRIFKDQGDALVDEIDSALDVRKELIYTLNTGEPVPEPVLKFINDLYGFFDQVQLPNLNMTINDIVHEHKRLTTEQFQILKIALAEALISRTETSPIKDILKKFESQPDKIKQLQSYLLDQNKPKFLESDLTALELDQIALIKQEINQILPLTLSRNRNEHYGLSESHKNATLIPVPYVASNTPSTSEFGNYVETINYTLQVHRGALSKKIVRKFVEEERRLLEEESKNADFSSQARNERFEKLTGHALSQTDFSDATVFNEFYEKIKNNKEVREYCLLNYVLSQITKNTLTLTNNAHNFVGMLNTVQGMTGTPWNFTCYADKLKFNAELSRGVDGKTLHNLIKDAVKPHLLPFLGNPKNAIDHVLKDHPNPSDFHAWIDVGAHFRGISNVTIAEHFSNYFANDAKFSGLKYVLYFGSDDKLYALSTEPNKSSTPILLEKTDSEAIQAVLKCTPDQCFTYYDQRHTIGADILQTKHGRALVPIGLKTMQHDLLQAVMRMRELGNGQAVEFIISKDLQDMHPHILVWDVDSIIKICADNEVKRLQDDNFKAALQKIQNVIWEDCYKRILDAPTDEMRLALVVQMKSVFVAVNELSPYEQFGDIKKFVSTETVLKEYAARQFCKWKEAVNKPLHLDAENITKKLDEIITNALPHCASQVESPLAMGELSDTQVELKNEIAMEKLNDIDLENHLHNSQNIQARPIKVMSIDNSVTATIHQILKGDTPLSIQAMVASNVFPRTWKFDNNISGTDNFTQTAVHQPDLLDNRTKDPVLILIEQDDRLGKINFLILTAEEADQINQVGLGDRNGRHFWIETLHQVPFLNDKPEHLHPGYTRGLEQIALLSGDTDVLNSYCKQGCWLAEQAENKLEFLERVIMPKHLDKNNLLKALKQKLAVATLPVHLYSVQANQVRELKSNGSQMNPKPGV